MSAAQTRAHNLQDAKKMTGFKGKWNTFKQHPVVADVLPAAKNVGIGLGAAAGTYGLGKALQMMAEKLHGDKHVRDWKDARRRVEGDFLPNE